MKADDPRIFELLDHIEQLRALCDIAVETLTTVDDWMGHASTRQAAQDALWRLHRALQKAGFPSRMSDDLRWRGSIIRALEQAGLGIGECGTVRVRRKTDLPHMYASGTQITPDRLWSVLYHWGDPDEREQCGHPPQLPTVPPPKPPPNTTMRKGG